MTPLAGISTLVFDLDGTLCDPRLGIYRCLNFAMADHDLEPVSEDQVIAQIGPPLDAIFRTFLPEADAALIVSLVNKYRERYAELGYAESRLYPGIPEALLSLSKSGVPMGVCTSKRRDFAERILTLFGLRDYFAFVDGGDIGIAKREQLSGLLQSGSIDDRAVMIGDRYIDIESARANGLRGVGVLWGFGDRKELVTAGADRILGEPLELMQLLAAGVA